ncbi:hypothetical protein Ancab_007466 [Ancistrocladus abbreviatus]
MAIGACFLHKFMDAKSCCTFLSSWSKVMRDEKEETIGPDFTVGVSNFPPMECQVNVTNEPPKKCKRVLKRFVFNSSSIDALKSRAKSESMPHPPGVETVSSFLWKRFMAVKRKVSSLAGASDGKTNVFGYTINMRKYLKPPVPEDSFGNILVVELIPYQEVDQEMLTSLENDQEFLQFASPNPGIVVPMLGQWSPRTSYSALLGHCHLTACWRRIVLFGMVNTADISRLAPRMRLWMGQIGLPDTGCGTLYGGVRVSTGSRLSYGELGIETFSRIWLASNGTWPSMQSALVVVTGDETTMHALRDCYVAKRIWKDLAPSEIEGLFTIDAVSVWVMANLNACKLHYCKVPWPLLFGVTQEGLWHWRNLWLFDDGRGILPRPTTTLLHLMMNIDHAMSMVAKPCGLKRKEWVWLYPMDGACAAVGQAAFG